MGEDCDIMVARHGISRENQDLFAIRSHDNAEKAWREGHHFNEVVAVQVDPKFNMIQKDNGIRSGSKIEKLAKLRPAFDKKKRNINRCQFLVFNRRKCGLPFDDSI